MLEAIDIALYIAAFLGAAIVPIFLWHLWLAPYKLLEEQIDSLGKQLHSRVEAAPPNKKEQAAREIKRKIQETKLKEHSDAIEWATNFIQLINDDMDRVMSSSSARGNASERTNLLILKEDLIGTGVIPESYRGKADYDLKRYLEGVLPYIIRHGIEEGVVQYQNKRISDDEEEDEDEDV